MSGLKQMFALASTIFDDTTVCPESQDEEGNEDPTGHLPESTTLPPVHFASSSIIGIPPSPAAFSASAALFGIPTAGNSAASVTESETGIIEDALFDLLSGAQDKNNKADFLQVSFP